MQKLYCDHCERELTPDNSMSVNSGLVIKIEKRGKPDLHVQVLEGNGTVPVSGSIEFCKHCVIDAVKTLDDRPRMEQECRHA